MKRGCCLLAALVLVGSWLGAQEGAGGERVRPLRSSPEERMGAGGERGRGAGERSRRGGRDRGEMFRKLSEEERERVRVAFEKVWVRPEVEAAKVRLREANDEYRKVVDAALLAVDPEVVELLNKVRPAPMPEFEDVEFVKKVLERLRSEGASMGGGRGEELHEKVMAQPVVVELLKKLNEVEVGQRRGAWEAFREAYFRALREEMRGLGGRGERAEREGEVKE